MYAMDFAQVGVNIQKELDNRSMTQQSLADALSISKQVMSKIVKGSKAINVNELAKIAYVLGTTTDALLSVDVVDASAESMVFMGAIQDENTRKNVEMIRTAIDEIQFLEKLNHV